MTREDFPEEMTHECQEDKWEKLSISRVNSIHKCIGVRRNQLHMKVEVRVQLVKGHCTYTVLEFH